MTRLREAAAALLRVLMEAARADNVQAVTLLTVLLHGGVFWYYTAPLTILAAIGLLVPRMRTAPGFWLVITCLLAAANTYNWFAVDNHKFLMTWWCLAIYCSMLSPEPDRLLVFEGKILLSLCFLFAVVWKLMAPDYLDGSFFRQIMLTDQRFESAAKYATGADGHQLARNRRAFSKLTSPLGDQAPVKYEAGPYLDVVATVATWWTILIEASLAVAFLLPSRPKIEFVRHALLVLFLFTTYAVAPVIPYGWTLLVMGLACCPAERTRMRAAYILALFALPLYSTPLRPS